MEIDKRWGCIPIRNDIKLKLKKYKDSDEVDETSAKSYSSFINALIDEVFNKTSKD